MPAPYREKLYGYLLFIIFIINILVNILSGTLLVILLWILITVQFSVQGTQPYTAGCIGEFSLVCASPLSAFFFFSNLISCPLNHHSFLPVPCGCYVCQFEGCILMYSPYIYMERERLRERERERESYYTSHSVSFLCYQAPCV